MKKILLVAKKEWYRFFSDRRIVISALVFPCVLLYVVYSFLIPYFISITFGKVKNKTVYAINAPDVIKSIYGQMEIDLTLIPENDKETVLRGIEQKNGNFLLVFPQNFTEDTLAYDVFSGEEAPEVLVFYNSLADSYIELYPKIISCLQVYEKNIALKFTINQSGGGDLAPAADTRRFLLASVLPILLLLFIFQGSMAVTTEAITGEKERGTFAAILLTSITPMEISAGKITALGIESFLCGISATLGIVFSLPKFINSVNSLFDQGDSPVLEIGINSLSQYGIGELCLLILLLLSTSCFIVTVISLISINAKTVKEAQMFIYPLIIVFMFISFISTMNSGEKTTPHYFIPVYNSVLGISGIISQNLTIVNTAATIGANLLYAGIGCFILSHLIRTEKIVTC